MTLIYLGIGSNLQADQNLLLASVELRRRFRVRDVSSVYSNPALGFSGDDFLNAVMCAETAKSPIDVCTELEEIHTLAGRSRGGDRFRSRTLDIDLLLYGTQIINQPPVVVPRADILEYSFVLKPLCEISPELVHPVTGQTMSTHWAQFDDQAHPLTTVELVL